MFHHAVEVVAEVQHLVWKHTPEALWVSDTEPATFGTADSDTYYDMGLDQAEPPLEAASTADSNFRRALPRWAAPRIASRSTADARTTSTQPRGQRRGGPT